jgi:hypothetical protein
MSIIGKIVDKLHAIIITIREDVHAAAEAIKDKIEEKIAEHHDIPPEELAAKLDHLAAADPQKLHWRTSIVDFLKLLDEDSSLATRKEMAGELGRTDYTGSAADNVWLHGEVFQAVIKRGIPLPKVE